MFLRTTSSALAVLALTSPVFAEVTPAEVWQNWIDYYRANGYTVTEGAREEAGETLTLRDVAVSFADPAGEAKLDFSLPEVTLTATGDGGVRTTMAETMPVQMVMKNAEDEEVTLKGNVTMKDGEIVSTGSPADMTHVSRAGEMAMVLDTVTTSEGEKTVPVSVKLVNVTSNQRMVDGDTVKVDATMDAERLDLAGEYDDQSGEQPGKLTFDGSFEALKFAGNFAMPKGVDIASDMNAALKAGMDLSGTMSAGAGKLDFTFAGKTEEGKDQAVDGSTGMQGFDLAFGMSAAGLKYQGSADASSAEMTISDVPFPISYAIENTTFDLQMPVMKADEPAPFKFAYSIGGLTLADAIWDLFDAGKQLPRDPASLDIDVTGLARVAMDLFDPANIKAMEESAAAGQNGAGQAPEPADAPAADAPADGGTDTAAADAPADAPDAAPNPFEPTEITINKIALDAVGAKVDASGSLAAPADGGIEQPVGRIDARLEGVNGLIDRLAQMGFIPQDQVAGVRMMLAMFARPAPEGGDALIGEFEFKEGGQIFANGQQVK